MELGHICTDCQIDRCWDCSNSPQSCLQCEIGLYYNEEEATCDDCDDFSKVLMCEECTSFDNCTKCGEGYRLGTEEGTLGQCFSCNDPGCAVCNELTANCQQCKRGFFQDEDTGMCKPCTGACLECENAESCTSCN